MKHKLSRKDGFYLLLFCFFLIWVALVKFSGCAWNNAPLAFVRGCTNHGFEWNTIIAPMGMIAILALPISLLYWLCRLIEVLYRGLMRRLGR